MLFKGRARRSANYHDKKWHWGNDGDWVESDTDGSNGKLG